MKMSFKQWVLSLGLALTTAAPALAACQSTLDFSGAVVNSTRTLDVSTCHGDVRCGLYRSLGIEADRFAPVSGTAFRNSAPDAANITLPNGAVLQFSPAATENITNG